MAYRPKDLKERILHRLRITQGHLRKVAEMVDKDEYCINVLHQSQAVQSAIKETDNLILENHLKTCVSDNIQEGKSEEVIAEIMEVFKKKSL